MVLVMCLIFAGPVFVGIDCHPHLAWFARLMRLDAWHNDYARLKLFDVSISSKVKICLCLSSFIA